MTFLKKAIAGARPDRDVFHADTNSTGVLVGILALVFAPIAIAHVVCLADANAGQPAAIERAAR